MKIDHIEMKEINIPFKESFAHASKTRNATETVLVKVKSEDLIGYGEGCPRQYVTGEDIQSCHQFLLNFKEFFLSFSSLVDLKKFQEDHSKEIDKNPAAFCAVELAILDLIGKAERKSIEELLAISKKKKQFYYSAILGVSNRFDKTVSRYLDMGFSDFKVKLSGDQKDDEKNLEMLINILGDSGSVRVDANNLWIHFDLATEYLQSFKGKLCGIEEPIITGDYLGMEQITIKLESPIILDESFKTFEDFDNISDPKNWLINLRVSKMGGLLRSLKIIKEAKARGFKLIVGAHVGETSILTRAALVVARACGDNLLFQEGAFGTHLLEEDIVDQPLQFLKAGELDLEKQELVSSCGLGLNINKTYV